MTMSLSVSVIHSSADISFMIKHIRVIFSHTHTHTGCEKEEEEEEQQQEIHHPRKSYKDEC